MVIDQHTSPEVFLVAEIGVSHMGSSALAIQLADQASAAGFDFVKLQFRTPHLAVPEERRHRLRATPWGQLAESDYRTRIELGKEDLKEFDSYCRSRKISWTASCWDVPSAERLLAFDPPFIKIPSARLRDHSLLKFLRNVETPVMLSTGMSTLDDVRDAIQKLGCRPEIMVAHAVSIYPTPANDMNLRAIATLAENFPDRKIGYSAHDRLTWPSCVAIALGARFVEHHISLSRCLPGSDGSSSLDLSELADYCSAVKATPKSLGSGKKIVHEQERVSADRLRGKP